jgi:hypothetical protein
MSKHAPITAPTPPSISTKATVAPAPASTAKTIEPAPADAPVVTVPVEPRGTTEAETPKPKGKAKTPRSPITIVLTDSTLRKLRLLAHVTSKSLGVLIEEAVVQDLGDKVKKALEAVAADVDSE